MDEQNAYEAIKKLAEGDGNKDRKPVTAIPEDRRAHIVDLYRDKYYGTNFTHFTELLAARDQIHISGTVDSGHCIQFDKRYYKMVNSQGLQEHYVKGTKVMVIKAFDGSLYCSVNDKTVYALDEIPMHEKKSKDLDPDYQKPAPKKHYIPPMSHPFLGEDMPRKSLDAVTRIILM